MRTTKWIFIGYVAFVALLVVGMGISFSFTPSRDPHTMYTDYSDEIRTFDPASVTDEESMKMVGQIYEALYNYKYPVKPYEIVPQLAEGQPEYSDGDKVMTIRIRPGVRFYDPKKQAFPDGVGPEVKAWDVIYSFKRICDFNLASPNYSGIFQDNIVGLDDWWSYTQKTPEDQIDWDRPVEGFQVIDDHTIKIVLTHPNPQLLYNLALDATGIVCKKAVDTYKDRFSRSPVGTGAYYLDEELEGQRIVMKANPIYRGRPDIDGGTPIADADRLPHIKRMEYDLFKEAVPPWLLFTQGYFDYAGIPKESFGQAINVGTGDLTPELEKKGISLKKSPESATEYIGFNMQDPVLGKNKPLRQAMSMALDRQTFIKNFLNGRGTPAIGPIPPGFPTFDADRVNPYTQFNLELARQKMQEAVRINGGPIPKITILMRSSETLSRQMADFFSTQMAQIGLDVEPRYVDFARWIDMVDNRQTQLFDAGWVADYPDEQDFFQLFYGKSAPAGGINSSAYVNPAFDALYDKATIMQDGPERRKLYRQMEDMVTEDCPWLLEEYGISYLLQYDWLKGLTVMDYGYGFRQFLTIDEGLRSKRLGGF
jgi:ABC-type transport system substrate-binding protein